MAKIPKQRSGGQFGGSGGHRANRGAFRASGGNVRPPSKGCLVLALLMLTGTMASGYGLFELVA